MITLTGTGHKHKFEYMVTSGALAFDGLGWPHEKYFLRFFPKFLDLSLFTIVAKTLTAEPRKGNLKMYYPRGCIRKIHHEGKTGYINAVGLTNPGLAWWCRNIGPTIDRKKISLIASIYSEDENELVRMARVLDRFDLVGIENNPSCPNTEGGVVKNTQKVIDGTRIVYENSRHAQILKLSVVHEAGKIIPAVKNYVQAISINSVPWEVVFPPSSEESRVSPLMHLGNGGVSGQIAQRHTWNFATKIADMEIIPVISPSVWNYEDIDFLRSTLGLDAVSFGSLFLKNPCLPTQYVLRSIKERNQ